MAGVPVPVLTLTVTPPNGTATDYTRYLAWSGTSQSMGISQHFGRQGDTAVFPLVDEYVTTPNVIIPVMSQIKLVDTTAGQNVTLFAGVINDPILDVTSPTRNEWNLQCTDYTYYADNAIVHGTFINQTVDQIIVSLTRQANCGINATAVRSGGFVAPGPLLTSFVLNYSTLSDAWRKLAQLAGQVTPYGWYVDENLNLHFFDATSAINSGVTFTTSLGTTTGSGSTTEGHFHYQNSFGYEWDGTSIRNRIYVQGATQTIKHGSVATASPTDTFAGNGYQTSWPMRYTVTGSPALQVNGVATSVTVVGAGATSTATWQVVQNSIGAWSLITTGSAPSAGVVLKIWYDYQVPVVAVSNDYASQSAYNGPNHGVFAEYINDTSLLTANMALARAMRERTEYAFAAERLTFTTGEEFLGWVRAGETCTINNQFIPDTRRSYALGVIGSFIITENQVSFKEGGYRQQQLKAIRL